MITHFYKILYKDKDVVYVGVTTRKITERFKEHIRTKNLNKDYVCVEFDKIIHPPINSLETFYSEYRKVVELERTYIQKEKDNGIMLLNISKGGEWGADILSKLRKKYFFEKYGSYDNYILYKNKCIKIKNWLISWSIYKDICNTKKWLRRWCHKSKNKTKSWLVHWIHNRFFNKTKRWLVQWVINKKQNKIKSWLINWIRCFKDNKTKIWIKNWIKHKKENTTKHWLHNWVNHKSTNKTKIWISSWISLKSQCITKLWIKHWIYCRK